MTVVAYKDGVLASDSMVSEVSKGFYEGGTPKVFQLAGGILYGSAGDFDDRVVRDLLDNVSTPAQLPSSKALAACDRNVDAIIVFPDGQVFLLKVISEIDEDDDEPETRAEIYPVTSAYVAVGSGRQFAMGAMWFGASAAKSVESACEHSVWCRGPVQSLKLRPRPEK